MVRSAFVYLHQWFLVLLSLGCAISFGLAASSATGVKAREAGVILYSGHDTESLQLTTLQKDEPMTLIAEAVGNETWYMVRTRQGLIGWLRATDAILSEPIRRGFSQELLSTSTWSAQSGQGPTYGGTWSVEPQSSANAVNGTWTLQDAGGATIFSGRWSAEKFSTGWNGVWRAQSQGSKVEYSGSWSADLPHNPDAPFTDLFGAAARKAVLGVWTAGSQSGTWSIRAAK